MFNEDTLDNIQSQALQTGDNNFQFNSIGEIISAALPYVFFLAGVLLLIYFIIAGYSLMFSAGDAKAAASAKAKMTYAIIGFVIVFASYWIVQIVAAFLGLSDISGIFGNSPPAGFP